MAAPTLNRIKGNWTRNKQDLNGFTQIKQNKEKM